jgi:lipoprotein NlpI
VVAGAALLAIAGCASLDSRAVKAWTIEPVLNVAHSAESSQAYYTMGRYFDGSQAWDKAIMAYRKAIAADAHNIEAYNALGVALAQAGRFADAETTLRQAVALAPGLAHVRNNLGYVLMLAGKPGEAVTELKAAVRNDAGNALARANLRDALAQSDASQYGTAAEAARSESKSTPTVAASLESSEGTARTISVPTPITAAEIPTPLAASVNVPVALQTASIAKGDATVATASPMTLRVIDTPTMPSLVEQVANAATPLATTAVKPQASPATFAPVAEPGIRLEVSNGNGVAGMAARVGRWLATQGVRTDRLSNQPRFVQQQTVVQYRDGHEQAALRIARSLPANAKAESVPRTGLRSDVRVVLGRDWVQTAACLSSDTCRPAATELALSGKQ